MKPGQRFLVRIALGLLLAAGASVAQADAVFQAPTEVQADGSGEFRFLAVLTAGSDCVGWTGYGYQGIENVDATLWVDTFCIDPQPIEAGDIYAFTVEGRLVDLHLGGTVHSESYFCEGGGGGFVTTVHAPSVPAAPDSWSGLKVRYR